MALKEKTKVRALLYNELLRLNGIAAQNMEDSSLPQKVRDLEKKIHERGELIISLYRQGKKRELRELFGQEKTIVRKSTSPLSDKKRRRRKKVGRNKDKFRTI